MNLYLDDDSIKLALVNLLRQAKHDVLVPRDIDNQGSDDAVHLLQAILSGRVFLSYNHDDFQNLHELVIGSGGRHPGILMIRRDDDSHRDMKRYEACPDRPCDCQPPCVWRFRGERICHP